VTAEKYEHGAVTAGRWQRAVYLEGRRWAAAAAFMAERDGDLASVVELALSSGATPGQVRTWLYASGAYDSAAVTGAAAPADGSA
jgi:hypothetical protein